MIYQKTVVDYLKGLSLNSSILEPVTAEDIVTLISMSQYTKWTENKRLTEQIRSFRSAEDLVEEVKNAFKILAESRRR
jgi:hypothetical protein